MSMENMCQGSIGVIPHNMRCSKRVNHNGPHGNASISWPYTPLEIAQVKKDLPKDAKFDPEK